ncbi:MAG: glycosyltransferase family 2 protein [Acidobacteriota bacterium]
MKLGVVVVHFHTPELARTAVESVRDQAAEEALECEIVVVDNGSTPEGREILAGLEVAAVESSGRNLGYAGGFNRGVELLGSADAFMVMNPDLELLPSCLQQLVAALGGAGVVGPRFFWDRPGGFMLPPAEQRGRAASLRRFLAPRSSFWSRRARAAWRAHARRHWSAEEPLASHDLSGALLMIEAGAWRRVGPFDDGFPLYFEETDWLARARRAGVSGRYVPSAQALHHYARSTPQEPRSSAWFEQSHRRFRGKHYGELFTRSLHFAARRWPAPAERPLGEGPGEFSGSIRWLEIAAGVHGFPAASRRLGGDAPPAADSLIPAGAPQGDYVVRALGRGDRELWARRISVSPEASASG